MSKRILSGSLPLQNEEIYAIFSAIIARSNAFAKRQLHYVLRTYFFERPKKIGWQIVLFSLLNECNALLVKAVTFHVLAVAYTIIPIFGFGYRRKKNHWVMCIHAKWFFDKKCTCKWCWNTLNTGLRFFAPFWNSKPFVKKKLLLCSVKYILGRKLMYVLVLMNTVCK